MTATELNSFLLKAKEYAAEQFKKHWDNASSLDAWDASQRAKEAGYPANQWQDFVRKQYFNEYIERNAQ